jgi:hypothetical protein
MEECACRRGPEDASRRRAPGRPERCWHGGYRMPRDEPPQSRPGPRGAITRVNHPAVHGYKLRGSLPLIRRPECVSAPPAAWPPP